jgi:hypothetical protein
MNSNDMELLSGWFYSESYDMKINDPTNEPVIWTTPLLTSEVWEHPYAWNLLGLIADLESGSSAKKKEDLGRKATKGYSLQNYHKILATLLEGLIKYQQSGGEVHACADG